MKGNKLMVETLLKEKVEDKNKNIFKAEAVDEDVIMASTKAFIQGINKALNFKEKMKKRETSTI